MVHMNGQEKPGMTIFAILDHLFIITVRLRRKLFIESVEKLVKTYMCTMRW